MAKVYNGGVDVGSYRVTTNKPIDDRFVVDYLSDLKSYSTFAAYYYVGMVVYVKEDSSLYVLTEANFVNAMQASRQWSNAVWTKVGSDFVESDHTEYYAGQIGAVVVDTVDDLVDESKVTFAYPGKFAYVKNDGSDSSEDESGLYILTATPATNASNWTKIMGSTGGSSSTDTRTVINTDTNEAPTSGSGISVSTNDSTYVEEVYVDDDETGFIAGTYYTSRGLNADLTNDGTDSDQTLGNVDYIILTNGGDSYIRLYSKSNTNWIQIHKEDDTLGLGTVTYLDKDKVEQTWDETSDLTLTMEQEITCSNNVKFNGWSETRKMTGGDFVQGLVFGSTGSRYYDLDIYTVNVLPKVYAYSDGTQVQLLTTVDKTEIVNMITESVEPDSISEPDILALFNEDSD